MCSRRPSTRFDSIDATPAQGAGAGAGVRLRAVPPRRRRVPRLPAGRRPAAGRAVCFPCPLTPSTRWPHQALCTPRDLCRIPDPRPRRLKKGQKPPPVDPVNGIFPNCVRTIKQLIGRRTRHGDYEYEVKWGDKEMVSMDPKNNLYVPKVVLETHGFHKLMKAIDDKIAAEAGNVKPLTTTAIQRHLDDFGLHEEFGTYVPRPRPFSQLRGAMDSVSDFESGGCGFESRRSCRRTTIWTDLESEGYGFDSRIGLSRRSPPTDVVAEWSKPCNRVTRGAGFRHQSSGVGSNPTNIMAAPPSTDWRNGSASDSSPEGYVFESRIGHS